MVREGPAEPPPPSATEMAQARKARPYGMMITSAVIALVIIIVVYILIK
ncbi:hypothetical protein CI1B_47440 [Bradyrhizobium ivorense]|uniref:Uncharacterized protein n=1 Tax=Bradyrhizobium ivorense TaxID=2511166 RepID=A0A508TFA4_9BRAD|nr:hypothetical protein [Bradyrhizobium ivorense]MCC8936268.1 hypothetical protein [Bradyrhizobium ivorense]VIO67841.1 hypothetical protein CI41S_12130 [Bradyrhizobium ivorense]VIO73140.1 hypothetical protein CI1B_47440 [Bradyrhizobium ivorense]